MVTVDIEDIRALCGTPLDVTPEWRARRDRMWALLDRVPRPR
jgi:hypothetical protein